MRSEILGWAIAKARQQLYFDAILDKHQSGSHLDNLCMRISTNLSQLSRKCSIVRANAVADF